MCCRTQKHPHVGRSSPDSVHHYRDSAFTQPCGEKSCQPQYIAGLGFIVQQWNPFTKQSESQYWNPHSGRYESVQSLRNALVFKELFEEHLRRQAKVRVVDSCMRAEFINARELFVAFQCEKDGLRFGNLSYTEALRSTSTSDEIKNARREQSRRRFELFVDAGEEPVKKKRRRHLLRDKRCDSKSFRSNLCPIHE
jgi:hypothetical protein